MMKSLQRNIFGICTLTFLIICGFILLTAGIPIADQSVVAQNMTSLQSVCASTTNSDSNWAVFLGIAGLVYLKIIWKLIHASDMMEQ